MGLRIEFLIIAVAGLLIYDRIHEGYLTSILFNARKYFEILFIGGIAICLIIAMKYDTMNLMYFIMNGFKMLSK